VVVPTDDDPKKAERASRLETERRLLLDKINQIFDLLSSNPPSPSTGEATTRPSGREISPEDPAIRNPWARHAQTPPATTNPIGELEVRLKLAIDEYDQEISLFQKHVISKGEAERAGGKALLIAAQVEGLESEYQDEMDRLGLERRRKTAQYDKAKAQ